ncbi:MAG: hypothetical protein DMG68_12190 [Acidobacteria bacterium]|jgi:hypothetical protein|nr:MAG: hypothetical protein DMG68_12190 [Acidobacteriota bacterium]
MSTTAHLNKADLMAPPLARMIAQRSFLIGAVFAVLALIGAFLQPDQFFRSYVLGFMDWLALPLGCMALLMLIHMTGGTWAQAVRRIFEAATRTIPLMAVLFIPILFGAKRLYVWMRPQEYPTDKHLQEITRSYLTFGGFIGRAVLYFAVWLVWMYFLNRWSAEQDEPGRAPRSNWRFRALSGPGLILYAFTVTFASIDWIMSMDPSWISTMYGLLFVAGQLLNAICFTVVAAAILIKYKPASDYLKPDYIHDYGKLMLTFVMVWAYFSFSQWLIIWAGNLPDEISWYLRRLHGGWQFVGLVLALFHFAFPFLFLLSRSVKRRIQTLVWLAVWLMVMRFIDLFWIIEPNFYQQFHVSWLDIVVPVAIGGFWFGLFFRELGSRPLLPLYDINTPAVLEPAHHE